MVDKLNTDQLQKRIREEKEVIKPIVHLIAAVQMLQQVYKHLPPRHKLEELEETYKILLSKKGKYHDYRNAVNRDYLYNAIHCIRDIHLDLSTPKEEQLLLSVGIEILKRWDEAAMLPLLTSLETIDLNMFSNDTFSDVTPID